MALLHFGIFHSNSTSGFRRRLGQVNLHAVAGGLDVADVHLAREGGRPEPCDGPATGVERQVIAGSLVEPARRHDPGVLVVEVALLRSRDRRLVPRVALIDGIAERIGLDEGLAAIPVVVEGTAEQNADVQVDVNEIGGHQLAVHDHARGDEHRDCPSRSCSCRCNRRPRDR